MLNQTPPFVDCDPEIQGGMPCFAGTRVNIDAVVASLDAGMTWAQLVDWVPGITPAHVEAARHWLEAHSAPRAARVRDAIPNAVLVSKKRMPWSR
jgi:uncharacterized protein (DUF433 family)